MGWLSRNRSWIRHEGWLSSGWVIVGVVVGWLKKWLGGDGCLVKAGSLHVAAAVRRGSEDLSEGIRRIRRGLPEEEP